MYCSALPRRGLTTIPGVATKDRPAITGSAAVQIIQAGRVTASLLDINHQKLLGRQLTGQYGIESGDRRQIADFETNLNGPPYSVALLQHSQ